MTGLLVVVAIFTAVLGIDYLFYLKEGTSYEYVSRRTSLLFILGQIVLMCQFWDYFKPFVANAATELTFIAIQLFMILLFSAALMREKLLVCHTSSRTERCLTPGYVFTKGPELMFQQMAYLVAGLSLVEILGLHFYTYVAFAAVLLIMHTPVILSMNKPAAKRLTLGIFAISGPILYSFTAFHVFWPALYVHALLYVFLWLTFADWEGKTGVPRATSKV